MLALLGSKLLTIGPHSQLANMLRTGHQVGDKYSACLVRVAPEDQKILFSARINHIRTSQEVIYGMSGSRYHWTLSTLTISFSGRYIL